MHFTKMQGAGNDYIYVNGFAEKLENPGKLAILLSDRHFGVGADGLIIIAKSDVADFRMIMYNSDGSRGEMCGNGIRCAVAYAYKYGIVKNREVLVETDAGNRRVYVGEKSLLVNMGEPETVEGKIPDISFVKGAITAKRVTTGNPHFVVFVKDIRDVILNEAGPGLETAPEFPDRANIEFVQMLDAGHMLLKVWERGSGETLSCGTGTCAAAYAAFDLEFADKNLVVYNPGGALEVIKKKNTLWLSGPAEFVFEGEWYILEEKDDGIKQA